MRLIIDIDDEMVCNDIKNKALEPTSETDEVIINALYNGTPYNPSGDLISREALKKDLKQYFTDGVLDGVSAKLAFNQILHDIDNAPTVDMNTELSVAYLKGRRQGQSEERPKGEWITRHKLNSFGQDVVCFECNKCGEYKVPLYHLLITEPLKVCPCCGAEMRKGGAV